MFALLTACDRGNDHADHPDYFQKVYQRADLLVPGPAAFRILDSIYAQFPGPGPMDLVWKYRYKLDYYWMNQVDRSRGRIYIDSILKVLSGKTNRPGYAAEYGRALIFLGDINRDEGKLDNALSLYYEGRTFIQRTHDTCALGEYSAKLAMVYYQQRKYDMAIPYFKNAFTELGACREKNVLPFQLSAGGAG